MRSGFISRTSVKILKYSSRRSWLTINCRAFSCSQSRKIRLFGLASLRVRKVRTKTFVSSTTRARLFRTTIHHRCCFLFPERSNEFLNVLMLEVGAEGIAPGIGQQLLVLDALDVVAQDA